MAARGAGPGPLVWFVTGAARGFGRAIVDAALDVGDVVVAAVRDPATGPAPSDRLLTVSLDVTDEAAAPIAVDRALERFGRIDVLVNNAGFGLVGAVEESSAEQVRELFETNVFGLLHVTRAVLPVLRARRRGHVVNIGSVAGIAQGAGVGIYGATKSAVEGLSEAMDAELAGVGVAVTVVEPGQFRTDFMEATSLRQAQGRLADYEDTAGARRLDWARSNRHQPGDPVRAAAAIVDVVHGEDPPLRLPLGRDCLERVEAKLARLGADFERFRAVAESTDHVREDRHVAH